MPEVKGEQNTMEGVMSDHNYPSSVDDMMSNDTPFEGTATSLPDAETNPIFGADGTLPVKKISKIVE